MSNTKQTLISQARVKGCFGTRPTVCRTFSVQSADRVSAEWEHGRDERGRKLYTLRLSDSAADVSASFTTAELRNPRELRGRMLSLWGDLLEIQSNQRVKRIQQMICELA